MAGKRKRVVTKTMAKTEPMIKEQVDLSSGIFFDGLDVVMTDSARVAYREAGKKTDPTFNKTKADLSPVKSVIDDLCNSDVPRKQCSRCGHLYELKAGAVTYCCGSEIR